MYERAGKRAQYDGFFFRLDVSDMPSLGSGASASAALLYGLNFTAGGAAYEVRAQRATSDSRDGGASFGLFRCGGNAPVCDKVARLKGGYGTTGSAIVLSIPIEKLGGDAVTIGNVRALSALGSYAGGPVREIDHVRISERGRPQREGRT